MNDDDKPPRDWETWKRDRAAERRRAEISGINWTKVPHPEVAITPRGAVTRKKERHDRTERQVEAAVTFFTTAGADEIARLICRPYKPRKALKKGSDQ